VMEQLSIFDAPRLILGDFYLALEKGEWDSLPGIMDMLEQLGVKLDNWPEKRRFWLSRRAELRQAENLPVREKGAFLEKFRQELAAHNWMEESLYFEKYWLRRILKELPVEEADYITPTLHLADCYLKLGKYRKAAQAAENYCAQKQEDARLRSIQAYCLYKMNQLGRATATSVFAMFYDPFTAEPAYFYNPQLMEVLNELREQHGNEQKARAIWPWESWLRGIFEIPPSREFAEKIENLYTPSPIPFQPEGEIQTWTYFNHLLYLCEVKRRESRRVTGRMIELCSRMQQIRPELYPFYLQRVDK